MERHLGLVGRVVLKQCFEFRYGCRRIDEWRQSQTEFKGGVGTQHVTGIFECWKAFGSRHTQGRFPGATDERFDRVECRREGDQT